MRLTKDYIGKKVRRYWHQEGHSTTVLVGWVKDGCVAGTDQDGKVFFSCVFDDWELVGEKKKPSERIREILRSIGPRTPGEGSMGWQESGLGMME